jgi:hypothetical protein
MRCGRSCAVRSGRESTRRDPSDRARRWWGLPSRSHSPTGATRRCRPPARTAGASSRSGHATSGSARRTAPVRTGPNPCARGGSRSTSARRRRSARPKQRSFPRPERSVPTDFAGSPRPGAASRTVSRDRAAFRCPPSATRRAVMQGRSRRCGTRSSRHSLRQVCKHRGDRGPVVPAGLQRLVRRELARDLGVAWPGIRQLPGDL